MNSDPRIDAYIEKAQPFAKPILIHLRKLVHQASPDITETIKWGAPFFEYKGLIGGMAAFKQHCAFNFMKRQLMKDVDIFDSNNRDAKGHLGKITSLEDLPDYEVMIGYIKEAVQLNEEEKRVDKKAAGKKETAIPEEVKAAFQLDKKASDFFDMLPPSHKKEYIVWITEAKTEPTRNKRLATMMEWLAEGKRRDWQSKKP